jgi:hypothetical protein
MSDSLEAARTAYGSRILYDRREAARQLSMSIRSLDYRIQQQQIATRRNGKKIVIHHSELERFARGNHTDPIRQPRTRTRS